MKLPEVSQGVVLGGAIATNIVVAAVGGPLQAAPVVWAAAGVYSLLRKHPWWGTGFLITAMLSQASISYLQAKAVEKVADAAKANAVPTGDQATAGALGAKLPTIFGLTKGGLGLVK